MTRFLQTLFVLVLLLPTNGANSIAQMPSSTEPVFYFELVDFVLSDFSTAARRRRSLARGSTSRQLVSLSTWGHWRGLVPHAVRIAIWTVPYQHSLPTPRQRSEHDVPFKWKTRDKRSHSRRRTRAGMGRTAAICSFPRTAATGTQYFLCQSGCRRRLTSRSRTRYAWPVCKSSSSLFSEMGATG